MMKRCGFSILCLSAGVLACASESAPPDTTRAEAARALPAPDSPAVAARPRTEWRVTARGIGPLEAGMTPAQARSALGLPASASPDSAWKSCGYAALASVPPAVRVMVEEGTIARVEVRDSSITTVEGARVGDSEAKIIELYRGRVDVQPLKYGGGHALVVRPAAAADTLYRLVFETDGRRVVSYRAGRRPPVEYVEACG